MTKLTGPLFSRSATATLARLLTFVRTGAATKARQRVTPDDPRSGLQISARAMMRFLASQWTSLTAAQKLTWAARATLTNVSPYHAYLARNLQLWRGFHAPSKSDPWTGTGSLPTSPTTSGSGGVRHAHFTVNFTLVMQGWAAVIFRSKTTGFTTSRLNAVAILPIPLLKKITFVDHALPPGTYYYKARHFTTLGKLGPALTQRTAIVTAT